LHDDSDSDDLESRPNFEPLQLLGFDRSRLEQALTQNFKDWNFDCELVEPDL
jgi:hypothetical protein